jgi:hypothetical protein
MKHTAFLFILLCLAITPLLQAQGDGPESHFIKPQKMWGLNFKYLNLNQNMSVNGDILTPNLNLEINAFPITVFHVFSIKGQYAEVIAMMNPTSISSTFNGFTLTNRTNSKSGFSDGFVGFKIGMVNGKAKSLEEYASSKIDFVMMSYFRVWYSGSYDNDELVNIGTNRTTFEYGIPTTMPLFSKNDSSTNLELFPSIRFFTKNDDVLINPATGQTVGKKQAPLFVFENHIIHNFNKKFRATLNGRYQLGGQTTTDGMKDDNAFNNYGATIGLGYQLHPLVYIHADYGGLLFGDDDAESNMFRFNLQLNYLKLKKNKELKTNQL